MRGEAATKVDSVNHWREASPMEQVLGDDIGAVRAFNRFYTGRIGALNGAFLDSPFSLTEVRVLYELAHRTGPLASDLEADLGLDAGYLSRMLKRFGALGLARQTPDPADRRRRRLSLTEQGRAVFAPLEQSQQDLIGAMLGDLEPGARAHLTGAMAAIRNLLDDQVRTAPVVMRPHRPGDLGWIVGLHGEVYARDYGWDPSFEALTARICAEFVDGLDPARERCWIAERAGERLGSIMLVKRPDQPDTARLRLLLVAPWARGLGLGGRLVEACLGFAAEAGYRRVSLWTCDILVSARRIYEAAGFRLVQSEPRRLFGHDLVTQTFELDLNVQ
jgi:DNA-binding MarR family transcriptional regulator/GNAT superfamily N-acetyltransferase